MSETHSANSEPTATAAVEAETTEAGLSTTSGEVSETGGEAGGETEPSAAAPPAAPAARDWRENKIAKLSQRTRELQAELAKYQTPGAAPAAPQVDQAEIERLAQARAETIASQRVFTAQCEEVAQKGKLAFPDFDSRVQGLVQLVDKEDPTSVAAYNQFIQAAIETGEAPGLIHRLGGDLNTASRLLALPPVKMAIELAKLAALAPAQATAAPKPIRPLANRGPSHEAIDPRDPDKADHLATRTWIERREKQVAEAMAGRR